MSTASVVGGRHVILSRKSWIRFESKLYFWGMPSLALPMSSSGLPVSSLHQPTPPVLFLGNDAIAESSLQNLCCTWRPWDGIIFSTHGRYFSSIASTAATRAGGTAVVNSVVNPNLEQMEHWSPNTRNPVELRTPNVFLKNQAQNRKFGDALYDSMTLCIV